MPKRKQTLEEIARYEDAKVAQGREAEGLMRVKGEPSNPSHIMQIEFSPDEIALIRSGAEASGVGVLQFVRDAILGASRARND